MRDPVVAVVGLGYVGLPLAVEFGRHFETIGFDVSAERVSELRRGLDRTLEISADEIAAVAGVTFTASPERMGRASVYIVSVPTPIDSHKRPDLTALVAASETVGALLTPGDTVVYESTVYPGATEEVCVPVLEAVSGLRLHEDFGVGYSPERINPGDREHRLPSIVKVTSGSNPSVADFVDRLYATVVTAGTHRAPSIRVAEAAKVIENTQRDVNIALMNELAILFDRLGLDTQDVLAAAGTKWNFLPFRPGLVGGHCIGVDPYYLTYKAQEVGHHPEVILAGRRINDAMGGYVADTFVRLLARAGHRLQGARVLVMGLAFKADVPDVRNTRVFDLISHLGEYGICAEVCDPLVDRAEATALYGLTVKDVDQLEGPYIGAVLAVAHEAFRSLGPDIRDLVGDTGVILDIPGLLPREFVDARI